MVTTEIKVRENRMRRKAKRCGLVLEKIRRLDPDAVDYNRFVLIDAHTGNLDTPSSVGYRPQFALTLEQVEAHFAPEKKAKPRAKKKKGARR